MGTKVILTCDNCGKESDHGDAYGWMSIGVAGVPPLSHEWKYEFSKLGDGIFCGLVCAAAAINGLVERLRGRGEL